jgi:microcystin degradation protein MlrC
MLEAGEGGMVHTWLGAKTDTLHGDPIEVHGRAVKIHGHPIPMDSWSGTLYDVGPICVLELNGILVVVTEQKLITENIDILKILGFDVTRMQAVGFKGLGLHIRQALAGKVEAFVPVDGVGLTHPDVRKLGPYRRIRRPVWPLDEIPEHGYPLGHD